MSGSVEFSKHGPFLSTRHLGEVLRNNIIDELDDNELVVLDFDGIDGMSHSFADECIGKLAAELGREKFHRRIKFMNVGVELQQVIRLVVSQRLSMAQAV